MKKFLCMLLTALLLLGCTPFALAAGEEAKQAADTLFALGLFQGTAKDAEGRPIYELERTGNRVEALVMLIRLLGKLDEALAHAPEHPFSDVPPWADRYVAYAYDTGLTKGVSSTEFGAQGDATEQMFLTFVLRALGYADTGASPDFSYSGAVAFAAEKGLPTGDGDFLRGDMAVVSLAALSQPLNGQADTLISALAEAGAVDAQTAADRGFVLETPTRNPVRTYGTEIDWGARLGTESFSLTSEDLASLTVYRIDARDILDRFPDAVMLSRGISSEALAAATGLSRELIALESAAFNTLGYNPFPWCVDLANRSRTSFSPDQYAFVVDADCRVLAVYDPNDWIPGTAVFQRVSFDASAIRDEIRDFVFSELSHCWDSEITVELHPTLYGTEGTVFLNGTDLKELDRKYRLYNGYSSEDLWNRIADPASDAERDAFLCFLIFQAYYQPVVVRRADGTFSPGDYIAVLIQPIDGQCHHLLVIDAVTDDVVGFVAYRA